MQQHEHEDCHFNDQIYIETSSNNGIKRHKYCIHCGLVHEFGGKRLGFFQACLEELKKSYKITQVQERLILKTIADFDDIYGFSFEMQVKEFINVCMKYTSIPENVLISVI